MKKLLFVLVVLSLLIITSVAIAAGTQPLQHPPKLPYTAPNIRPVAPPQPPIQLKNISSAKMPAEKKWADYTPEEKAAYHKAALEARTRNGGETRVFTETSSICSYAMLEVQLERWLMKFPTLVVQKREYLSPIQSSNGQSSYNKCTTTLVVHYHEKSWWKFWE